VSVITELKQMRANYLYVLGEVNNPGMVNIMGPMGVAQAVAAAGGFKPTSDLSSVGCCGLARVTARWGTL
jgi:protein involved in polysaccharide export with SLBB domain